MKETNEKFRFENLDSIRTLAFLSTFCAHAFFSESSEILNSKVFLDFIHFTEIFSFGVPIFFVLSGFLITYLMIREQERFQKFKVLSFYVRRILRIWPLYFVVLFFGFVVYPLLQSWFLMDPLPETAHWEYYVMFLSNFDQIWQDSLPIGVGLGPTWSVSIEEQFYLVWPLLFLIFKRKYFIVPIVSIMLVSIAISSIYSLTTIHTLFCMNYLATGGAFGYLAYYHPKIVTKITHIHGVFFLGACAVLFVLIYAITSGWGSMWMYLFVAITMGYLILFQCYSKSFQLKKIQLLERWGKYTYGLYLYHVISIFVVHELFSKLLYWEESFLLVFFIRPIVSLLLSMVISYYSYHYFERFFLNLKSRFSSVNR